MLAFKTKSRDMCFPNAEVDLNLPQEATPLYTAKGSDLIIRSKSQRRWPIYLQSLCSLFILWNHHPRISSSTTAHNICLISERMKTLWKAGQADS
jgi:hypothetical protein